MNKTFLNTIFGVVLGGYALGASLYFIGKKGVFGETAQKAANVVTQGYGV